ncbi:hypothetical protein ONZ45_g2449 [Pleurotus djamor]|nr:hypothetical protein ONZ45_g2449 [Pleurotus djamor]
MKHLAEGELLREVTINRSAQRPNILSTLHTYILSSPRQNRRFFVKSLRVIGDPNRWMLFQDDLEILDTLIPQLPNLHTLLLSFSITPDANVLNFLRVPLPSVQLRQLGLDIELDATGDEAESNDGSQFSLEAGHGHALDISPFLRSQSRLSYFEYLHDDYISIKDDSIVFPNLRSFAGPLSFFNVSRSPTALSHLSIDHASEIDLAVIPELPSLISLSYRGHSPEVLDVLVLKTPNIRCLDTLVDLENHVNTRALAVQSLPKLRHLRIEPGDSTAEMAQELFSLPECQESLRLIEVRGEYVQRFFRQSLGESYVAYSEGCTDCVEFSLHENAKMRDMRRFGEVWQTLLHGVDLPNVSAEFD